MTPLQATQERGKQKSDSDTILLRRQRSSSRETLCRVRANKPANLFQEEPDMFESIKLNLQKTFMQTAARKVRLNRVKEKNKNQQNSEDITASASKKIEGEFTEVAKARKNDGDRTPKSETNATNDSRNDNNETKKTSLAGSATLEGTS